MSSILQADGYMQRVRLLHADQDATEVDVLPDWEVVTMRIIQNKMGVPAILEDDDTAVYLDWSEQSNLQAIAMLHPEKFEEIIQLTKESVGKFIDLDPNLEMGEWMQKFNEAMLITNFQTALAVLNQARYEGQRLLESEQENT
jgi:hypothetical protein